MEEIRVAMLLLVELPVEWTASCFPLQTGSSAGGAQNYKSTSQKSCNFGVLFWCNEVRCLAQTSRNNLSDMLAPSHMCMTLLYLKFSL